MTFINLTRPLAVLERAAYATILTPGWCIAYPSFEHSALLQSAKQVESLLQAAAAEQSTRHSTSIIKDAGDDGRKGNEAALEQLLKRCSTLSPNDTPDFCELSSLTPSEYAYLSSHLQVSHFLSHPLTVEVLKDELERQLCVENVLFLVHVQQWRLLHSSGAVSSIRGSLANQLVQHFIREGAPLQVNLNSVLRSKIEKAVARGSTSDASLFQLAEKRSKA